MPSSTPIFKPTTTKPPTQYIRAGSTGHLCLIRDAPPLHLWLALGGLSALLAERILGLWALLLAGGWVALCVSDALFLDSWFRAQHPHMSGVLHGRFRAQLPDEQGRFEVGSPGRGVTVFIVGARCNHPMGLFGPGFKELGEIMRRMQRGLDAEAEKYGLLGCSPWLAMERDYANSINFIMYFQNEKGLQDFARSELHREAFVWWAKHGEKYPHIHMWQETYVSPPGHWRSSHTNGAPTLLTACSVPVKTPEGATVYYNPSFDGGKGRTAKS